MQTKSETDDPTVRLSELAQLIEAIPAEFRSPLVAAAIGLESPVYGQAHFVLELGEYIETCVRDALGYDYGKPGWLSRDTSAWRPAVNRLSTCTDVDEVLVALRILIEQMAVETVRALGGLGA